ncbi:hypothetical protein Zm00014a_006986 [Zea mays]|uniref:Uncharacterized protein n=1 Tax=Zea mays TaxID=4577 RepID=A0A3L6DQJ8_MAIZE|nr:hypothetical protein Zm00014a_006986 [Zea mays]
MYNLDIMLRFSKH